MNLTKLFEMQKVLKDHIGYKENDKFEKMLLALIVEVGETANDWRGFKYWSQDKERKPSLLEEYVDGLHFILEHGLDGVQDEDYVMDYTDEHIKKAIESHKEKNITKQFLEIILAAATLSYDRCQDYYDALLYYYLALGEMLGFTTNEVFEAYMNKNKVNHERQDNGY